MLLSAKNISLDTQTKRSSKKLQPKYIEPYKVSEVILPVTYKLKLPDNLKIHPVFHISLLKKYYENTEEFPGRVVKPPPPIIVKDQEEFEVKKILDQRIHRKGRGSVKEYLVHWKGYSTYDATWESEDNLQNAQEAIQEFQDMLGQHS